MSKQVFSEEVYQSAQQGCELPLKCTYSAGNTMRMPVDPSESLICAVRNGDLESVRGLIDTYSLSYWEAWSNNGYNLLCVAREKTAEELVDEDAHMNIDMTTSGEKNYPPMQDSAPQGNDTLVKLLLSQINTNIYSRARDAGPLFPIATIKTLDKVVDSGLEGSPIVFSLEKNCKSVLQVAMKHGGLSTIELVLNYRSSDNNEENRNSLYAAMLGPAYYDQHEIIEALLRYGFNFYQSDTQSAKLLHAAVEGDCLKIVEALLKRGADVNAIDNTKKRRTLLHTAALHRRFDITVLLLRNGASVNVEDGSQHVAIEYAIRNGDANIIKLLLIGGAKVRVTRDLLHYAVKMDCCEIVEFLLNRAPDLLNATDIVGRTALHHTVLHEGCDSSSRVEIVNLLISRGACVNAKTKNGTTALHLAAEGCYAKVVEFLLAKKANVNALRQCSSTPLHSAAIKNNPTLVKILLDNGADVNARQDNGTTALHVASMKACDDIVKLLIERNADPDARDKNESTPLHFAATHGHYGVVITLLTLGATIDAQDNRGKTSLHHAAQYNRPIVVYVLLNNGADVNLTCKENMTPLDSATCGTSSAFDRHYATDASSTIEKHIVAIMAIGSYVSEKNLKVVNATNRRRVHLDDCQTQIANMKTENIGESNVTFYNVLTANTNQLVRYARHSGIVEALEPGNWSGRFPAYSRMIFRRLRQGQKRKNLLSLSLKSLNNLTGYSLPELSGIHLFSYLSDKDLQNVIKAGRSDDDRDS